MQINSTIITSLIVMGFFGGFTHCSAMCGPFVLTQVSNRLQNISLAQFSHFQKIKNFALLPYHLGRITTYSIIAFFCSLLVKNIQEIAIFKHLSAFLLLIAAIIFLQNLCEKKFLRLPFSLPKIKNFAILKKLFTNPTGFNGFFLGIILGFIPCGLLYGAFALAAAIPNPALASLAMFLFGIATFPALFLTAFGGYIFFKNAALNLKLLSKIIITLNIATLILLSFKLIFEN